MDSSFIEVAIPIEMSGKAFEVLFTINPDHEVNEFTDVNNSVQVNGRSLFIEDIEFISELSISPNPGNAPLTLDFYINTNEQINDLKLNVYNLNGEHIASINLNDIVSLDNGFNSIELTESQLTNLENGVYFLELGNDQTGFRESLKWVVQR